MSSPAPKTSPDAALGNLMAAALDVPAAPEQPAVPDDTLARTGNTADHQAGWFAGIDHERAEARESAGVGAQQLQERADRVVIANATSNPDLFQEAVRDLLAAVRMFRPAPAAGDALTAAARDVLAERQRQISVEGWEPERDDTYRHGELASAAASYAQCAGLQGEGATTENAFKTPFVENWPWSEAWWKPSAEPRRNLIKSGALILAEIERLDRAAIAAQRKGDA
ncbi:hypothetical protein ACOTBX_24690 [Achromobacter xylosoxidans]